MIKAHLNRFYRDLTNTLGVLEIEGIDFPVFTNELPWKFNRPSESCIPDGVYKMVKMDSPNHGKCFDIQDVTGRSYIRMHSGNTYKDSKGCILAGFKAGILKNEEAVLDSKNCIEYLYDKIEDDVELHIRTSAL